MIISQCFSGGKYITEELLLVGKGLDPLYVVGWEGFFGMIYYIILLPIFQHIKCSQVGLCSDSGTIENTTLALQQMNAYPWLIFLVLLSLPLFAL